MKPPRVFIKREQFWIEHYTSGSKKIRKAIGAAADIKQPDIPRSQPGWWKKSKHRQKIADAIRAIEQDRLLDELDLPARKPEITLPSLRELLDEYNIANEIEKDSKRSPATLAHRKSAVDFLLKYLPKASLYTLRKADAIKLRTLAKPDYAGASIRGYFLEIRLLLKYAVHEKYISENPFEGIAVAYRKALPREVSFEDLTQVLAWLFRHNVDAFEQFTFQALNALRISDVCRIEVASVDVAKHRFSYWNAKAKRQETCPLGPASMFLLAKKKPSTGELLFHYHDKSNLAKELERACESVGIDLSSHQLKRNAIQEYARCLPNQRLFDALAHHAPTVNKLAVEHYAGNDINLMRDVQAQAQKHWEAFLAGLYQ